MKKYEKHDWILMIGNGHLQNQETYYCRKCGGVSYGYMLDYFPECLEIKQGIFRTKKQKLKIE